MNPTQLQTFADDINGNADQTIIDAIATGNNNAIVSWYNENSTTWILKPTLSSDDIVAAIDWTNDYTAIKDDIDAIRLILDGDNYDPQSVNARNALNVIFAGATNTKTNVLNIATRLATRAEALFVTTTTGPGGGDGSTQGSAALAEWVGTVTLSDVRAARRL